MQASITTKERSLSEQAWRVTRMCWWTLRHCSRCVVLFVSACRDSSYLPLPYATLLRRENTDAVQVHMLRSVLGVLSSALEGLAIQCTGI